MSKKMSLIIALAAAAVFLLAACERSASNSPLATATTEGSSLVSLPTGISLVEAWGTSTAIYQQTAQSLLTASPTPEASSTPEGPSSDAEATPTAETTPVIVVPTSTPGRPDTYTLEKGEFPYCIARRFDVDPANMLALSGLNQGPYLPGLELKIPQTGSFPGDRTLHSHPTTYTVGVNDTLHSIACYFGDLDPTSIAAANGLSLDSPLTTGKVLNIP